MFKFGFGDCEIPEDVSGQQSEVPWFDCHEVMVSRSCEEIIQNFSKCQLAVFPSGSFEIVYLSQKEVLDELKKDGVKLPALEAEESHSDLLKGKYEGGLKVWECTKDLVDYLFKHLKFEGGSEKPLKGKKVLDLGCGTGIIGIVALMLGADVTFQDYNREVLDHCTIVNTVLNMKEDGLNCSRFFYGDWESFLKVQEQENTKYDLILSSETIYNPDNYIKLSNIVSMLLSLDGYALFAAKSCYFGVGGSTVTFLQHLKTAANLECETVFTATKGGS